MGREVQTYTQDEKIISNVKLTVLRRFHLQSEVSIKPLLLYNCEHPFCALRMTD